MQKPLINLSKSFYLHKLLTEFDGKTFHLRVELFLVENRLAKNFLQSVRSSEQLKWNVKKTLFTKTRSGHSMIFLVILKICAK